LTMTELLHEALDVIERRESRLLVWGLVDGRLSREELVAVLDPLLDKALEQGLEGVYDAQGVIESLQQRGFLFETDTRPYPGYRSRMAESVRLIFRLRQLFPKHSADDGWQRAPTLVADYRFALRRRKYPRRDIPVGNFISNVAEGRSSAVRGALESLLTNRAPDFSLAGFQDRAIRRILGQLDSGNTSATLVGAGTGSGKTLAFYAPVLAHIAARLVTEAPEINWVKCLAIYPRTELLRDQFVEAFREARRLDSFLASKGRPPIRVGALFGATPHGERAMRGSNPAWVRRPGGYVCAYMACPAMGCGGELLWPNEDIDSGREALECADCGYRIEKDMVALTRSAMSTEPPDILFTTTEMLNQRMSDTDLRHLFGLRPDEGRHPEVVLLDEVHTYSGMHGAQVAYLLRRWQHLLKAPVTFVGLSATLLDGPRFFADLTGVPESQVFEAAPKLDEMISEGAEYLLALRGDPVSRTALLSTTIQATMLLSRLLDTQNGQPSHGTYGNKIFAFTDDLDVVNRLYFSLLDAEGRNSRGVPDMVRQPNGGLAVLRTPLPSAARERYGQNWTTPQTIGHQLNDRKKIGRTSSQDPGVLADADVIAATASLEVGFNDPAVGAIIQHKAPREVGQFIQRRGRAGRSRMMRPWTVVVLSDYGRDRLAYQSYEQLFDPELTVRALPLGSRHIARMQSGYALIDYLSRLPRLRAVSGSVWRDLAVPVGEGAPRGRQQALTESLALLLMGEAETQEFSEFLGAALNLPKAVVSQLLWEFPRPLLTTVIPTALRRLSTNWRRGTVPHADYKVSNSPLPEFVPGSLFSDLNLPEVRILMPPTRRGTQTEPKMMPIAQALRTYAPGRVSRRFGIVHGGQRHWVAPPVSLTALEEAIDIDSFYSCIAEGMWDTVNGSLPVYRPYEIQIVEPENEVGDTSNAALQWQTQIVARHRGTRLPPPTRTLWTPVVKSLDAFLHSDHSPIEIRRFAATSSGELRVRQEDPIQKRFVYQKEGKPAAVGFTVVADALCFRLAIPRGLWERIAVRDSAACRALRTARFFDAAWSGEILPQIGNPFTRQWLTTVYLAAVSHEALCKAITIEESDAAVAAGTAALDLSSVLDVLFQSPDVSDDSGRGEPPEGQDRLRQALNQLLQSPAVLAELRSAARLLWGPVDESWEHWLSDRWKATLAAAVSEAIQSLCPDLDAEGLVVDVEAGPRTKSDQFAGEDEGSEIWVSESTPGGIGLIEEILKVYGSDPRRFYGLMAAALRPAEHELVDYQLGRFLRCIAGEAPVDEMVIALREFRGATSSDDSDRTLGCLRRVMAENGFALFHGFLAALTSRILRPGGNPDSDTFLHEALSSWDGEEHRLGIELDTRTMAHFLSRDERIDSVAKVAGLAVPDQDRPNWRFCTVYGLLWARGGAVRQNRVSLYNPFTDTPTPEPLLLAEDLFQVDPRISLADRDWRTRAMSGLAADGAITVYCSVDENDQLAAAISFFLTSPVQADYLSVYARISAIRRIVDSIELDYDLSEVA
jgi:hypothetical protein